MIAFTLHRRGINFILIVSPFIEANYSYLIFFFFIFEFLLVSGKIKNDFEIYKMLEHVMPETVILYANTINKNVIERYLQIKDIKLAVNGNDLKIMGIKSGKIYKLIFEKLLEEKLKNPVWSKLEEIEFVKNKFLH